MKFLIVLALAIGCGDGLDVEPGLDAAVELDESADVVAPSQMGRDHVPSWYCSTEAVRERLVAAGSEPGFCYAVACGGHAVHVCL